eukprot:gene11536-13464_t
MNSTAGNAVFRGDGIRVFGMDAELELKAQAKRDPAFEKELALWIEKATGMKLEFPDDLIESLRSGIVLCTLINSLMPDTIKKINQKPIPLMQIENIQLYIKKCWQVGVASSDLFVSSDLYQRKGIPAVIQNLAAIARASHNCPAYKGPTFGAKPSALPPVKKWDEIKIGQPVLVTDLEARDHHHNSDFCVTCGTQKACLKCDTVKDDNDKLIKEKQELASKLDKLNGLMKQQEEKLASLGTTMDQQRRQYDDKEKEMKKIIDNQKGQIEQKERDLKALERKSVTVTPSSSNSFIQPSITSPPLTSNSSSFNSALKPRNSGHFSSPPLSTTPPLRPVSGVFTSPTLVSANGATTCTCQKCNAQNKSTSKYCISCGTELAKTVAPTKTITTTTSSYTTTTVTKQPPAVAVVPNQPSPVDSPIYKSVVREKDELAGRVQLMLTSLKEQDAVIAKLNRAIADEKKQHEVKLREQKALIDGQVRQIEAKDREIKQMATSAPRTTSPSSSFIQATPRPVSPTFVPRPVSPTNQNVSTDKNRFTVQLNNGLRSTQAGPGSYRARSDSNPMPPVLPQPTTTSGVASKFGWPPGGSNAHTNTQQETTYTPNVTISEPVSSQGATLQTRRILAEKEAELIRLQKLVEQLEKKVTEETTKSKVKDSTIRLLEEKVQTFQARPRRTNQIVVGRKRFNSISPETLNTRLVEDTYKCLHNVLFSRPVEFHEVNALNALFKTEAGRRRFSQILQMTLKQVPNIVLSENSFEFILYLVNTSLQEMDLSNDTDIITAKVILSASSALYRVTNNQQEYVKEFIKSSPVWRNLRFWEDYFWEQLAKRHRKRYDVIDGVDKEIVSNLLSYFGVNMAHFQVPLDQITSFLIDMGIANGMTNDEVQIVLEFLQDSPQKKTGTSSGALSLANMNHNAVGTSMGGMGLESLRRGCGVLETFKAHPRRTNQIMVGKRIELQLDLPETLNTDLVKDPTLSYPKTRFSLSSIVNTSLQEMDLIKDTDIITAKVILSALSALYRVTNNQQENNSLALMTPK